MPKKSRAAKRQDFINLQQALLNQAQSDLEKWLSEKDVSSQVAIAQLVQYCNRFAKTYPKYENRSSLQNGLLEFLYKLKDEWIRQNKPNCVHHCKSSSFTNSYIDWQQLHLEKEITQEYQDPDDFEVTEVIEFYAYTFIIDGVEFRFHSKQVLFEEDAIAPVVPGMDGMTTPLSLEEQTIPALHACGMLALALDVFQGYQENLARLKKKNTRRNRKKKVRDSL